MIEVNHLTKKYGEIRAVDDVSFEVKKGEILGFLGPNGAGKTTTMRMLTGFISPTSGTATVAGFDVSKNSIEVRRRIGYLPEGVPLYTDMTVNKYLNFVAAIKGVPPQKRKKNIDETIEKTGCTIVANRVIKHLSKGFRQRVGIAQAIVSDPEILILDEPTIGLDPTQIIEIRELIKNLAGEHTVILSSHILPEVSMTCERIVIINRGKITAVDTPANLTKQIQKFFHIEVEVEGDEKKIVSSIESLTGVSNVNLKEAKNGLRFVFVIDSDKEKDIRKELAAKLIKDGFGLYSLSAMELSLEDIFVKLVSEKEAEQQ